MKTTKTKRKRIRKWVVAIVLLLIAGAMLHPLDRLRLMRYRSESIYVYNLTDDREELSLNAEEKRAPASLVKIMTVLVALEQIPDLSKRAPVSGRGYERGIRLNTSMAGFVSNERTTYRDLLYGTMLASGAECAYSLASNLSGDPERFTERMNEKATSLGLEDTCYRTVDGYDEEGQFSTAKDVAMLLKEALKNGNFRAIFTRKEFVSVPTADHPRGLYVESTVFRKLKGREQSGFSILGGKSGTTKQAGLCWAVLAEKDGKEYVVVVMGAEAGKKEHEEEGQVEDTLKILEEL